MFAGQIRESWENEIKTSKSYRLKFSVTGGLCWEHGWQWQWLLGWQYQHISAGNINRFVWKYQPVWLVISTHFCWSYQQIWRHLVATINTCLLLVISTALLGNINTFGWHYQHMLAAGHINRFGWWYQHVWLVISTHVSWLYQHIFAGNINTCLLVKSENYGRTKSKHQNRIG